jgi:hypothetical protein
MLHVATDAVMKVYRRGLLRAGRSTPPRIEISVDRWAHAYPPNTDMTLCGLKVEKLHWQPFRTLDFAAVNPAFHCPRCSVAAISRK